MGLGETWGPILAVLAAKGYEVVGIVTNPTLVEVEGQQPLAPVEEPRLQELLTTQDAHPRDQ